MFSVDKKILIVINELKEHPSFQIFLKWLEDQVKQRELDVIRITPEPVDYNFDIKFHYTRGTVASVLALLDIINQCDKILEEHNKLEETQKKIHNFEEGY